MALAQICMPWMATRDSCRSAAQPAFRTALPTTRHACIHQSCARALPGTALRQRQPVSVRAQKTDDEAKTSDPDETTKKYGLEAGLFKIFTSKEESGKGGSKGQQAKDLLKRYGSAYLITSISFAIVSFGACYALVSAGVDVAALLSRVGLEVSGTSEKVGTFAIAYAAHKALSPVRFPPTVALTPVVARALGKSPDEEQPPQD